MLIASTGQASTHTPQSTQASGSTCAFPSTMLIASLGHSSTQASQPVHFSVSTLAGINVTLSKENIPVSAKRGFYRLKLKTQ
jgi:hypothetical protein